MKRWVGVAWAVVVAVSACGRDPLLQRATPDVARADEEIVLSGSGFGREAGQVTFDQVPAQVVSWAPSEIRVRVPMQTHPDVTVRVKLKEGGSATLPFTIYDAMEAVDGSPGKARTFVTFTFDDTTADQLRTRDVLEAHGMRGTYYVNSTRIGSVADDLPPYMTLDEVKALQAGGHEVGGHTLHHLDLSMLEPDEVVRQVCGDRQKLLALGVQADHFAYPFGGDDDEISRIVESCGYASARRITRSRTWPLLAPPPERYAIPVWISVHGGIPLERLEKYVTEAEATEGAWAVFTFHRVCEGAGCPPSAVKPEVFAGLVDWLSRRQGRGTVVRTMRQMMGPGTAMDVSIPLPPPRTGPNLVVNPSLEAYSHGSLNPDCFMLADTGHELDSWSLVSPGHSGQYAVQLAAGDPLSTNRRMKMLQDDGACAPPVEPGGLYEFSVWYQSDVPVRFNAFVRNEQSFWGPWALSPVMPASPGQWSLATWRLPAIPAGMHALAVSVRLHNGDGSMRLDDFSIVRVP